jgi:nucleoside-diphosphate-sugar epimerase
MATRKARKPASERSSGGTVLFTGFPGFIGARLIPRLLELRPEASFECLVQEKFLPAADASVAALAASHPHTKGRIRLVTGDITAPGLGLGAGAAKALAKKVTGCFHLAAVYDLAVSKDVGMRINVEGTKNVLEFLGGAPGVRRFDYVSTAYVSGTAVGTYREKDLDVGQSFKNHYEETKFLAEVAVRESGLPSAIYRPGIVVGDSRTGETAKFDGPYFALNAMSLLPSPGAFLRIGDGKAEVNLVPVDFVLEAIARLGAWDDLSPDGPRAGDGAFAGGPARQVDREVLRLRPRAPPDREARVRGAAGLEVARDAGTDARLLRPPGPLRRRAGDEGSRPVRPRVPAVPLVRPETRRVLEEEEGRDHARRDDLMKERRTRS